MQSSRRCESSGACAARTLTTRVISIVPSRLLHRHPNGLQAKVGRGPSLHANNSSMQRGEGRRPAEQQAAAASGRHAPAAVECVPGCMPAACSRSRPAAAGLSRREQLLHSFSWPLVLGAVIRNEDPTTLLNSVLGAYFLPRLPDSQGFRLLDDLDNDFTLEFPRSWVGSPNRLRSGLNISDFNTSDKLTVEILPAPPAGAADPEELTRLIVTSTIVPGFKQGQADDKLALPSRRLIKQLPGRSLDGQAYMYLEFPSETITRSGYNIRRLHFSVAAIRRGSLYVCSASARSDQFNKDKEALLRRIVDSFQLR